MFCCFCRSLVSLFPSFAPTCGIARIADRTSPPSVVTSRRRRRSSHGTDGVLSSPTSSPGTSRVSTFGSDVAFFARETSSLYLSFSRVDRAFRDPPRARDDHRPCCVLLECRHREGKLAATVIENNPYDPAYSGKRGKPFYGGSSFLDVDLVEHAVSLSSIPK